MYGLKPVPFKEQSFSAACKAQLFLRFDGTTKEAAGKSRRRMEMPPSAAKAVPVFNRLCTG
jgi:hypothetical protein